jgi:plastocyanin
MKLLRHLGLLTAIAATSIALASCGGSSNSTAKSPAPSTGGSSSSGGASASGTSAVKISNFKFAPSAVTVQKGAKVTVTNNDSTTHTATADGGAFDTGDISQGSSKTITLTKPGTFAYHCSIHPFMKASIVVK